MLFIEVLFPVLQPIVVILRKASCVPVLDVVSDNKLTEMIPNRFIAQG